MAYRLGIDLGTTNTVASVRRRAEAARALLEPLPDGPARSALDDLCTAVVTRTA